MDFQFPEEQERFRQEVREFLARELPPDWMVGDFHYEEEVEDEEEWAFCRSMRRKLADKDWLSWWWPKEYGGHERPRIEYHILREELAYHGAPGMDAITYLIVAPAILAYGTEEQKRKHLPPLAKGEVIWCQGFSEPDAGSDLASLITQAVEDGEHFIVDGQKCWSTGGYHADWGFCLFRTDPSAYKHKGLSTFLVDLKSPGITINPVRNMAGLPGWVDIFFNGVRVPKENMLGEKNRGWYVAMSALNDERVGGGWIGACRRSFDHLVTYVKERESLAKNPIIRNKLASLATELEVARLFYYHAAWMQDKGDVSAYQISMGKEFLGQVALHIADAGLQILGLYGELEPGSKWAPLAGAIERTYLSYPPWTIASGSPEIQKNIIATMGLRLPR